MIVGLHHAQITVPDGAEEAAREFYCGLLGMQKVPKSESLRGRGGIWVSAGAHVVHIGTEDGVDRHRTKAHLAYEVADSNLWREKLEDAAVEILAGVPIPGFERFELRDPFGNRVELIQAVSDD